MAAIFISLSIGLPWLGALLVWWTGNSRPRTQHALAIGFSVAAGLASLALLPFSGDRVSLVLPVGGGFGEFTFVPDGLGLFLAAIATIIGCLAVISQKTNINRRLLVSTRPAMAPIKNNIME